MLKLKELELLGFKSFADKTRLLCDGSTAAVVGPNGCGKSNLSDAVSWVLGEQSARMLRGERMADVIFNGTGTRPPTGLAEVSMTLVQSENGEQQTGGREQGGEHPQGREIKVTRRLFRSGESEYLLNGDACRLRDIQDIFMGTGLGPESYAIIEQGRIGQILSSKPSDRRLIIEEAAGVSKFKSRKRLAEAKLESARQNLSRINDILEEISKQVNSLKRQASKAGRHRELVQELRNQQKQVYASRWVALEADFQKLQQGLTSFNEECSAAGRELEHYEQEARGATGRHEEIEAELRDLRARIAQYELEAERLRSRLQSSSQQAEDLSVRTAEAQREQTELRERAATLEDGVREKTLGTAQLKAERAGAEQKVREVQAEHEQTTRRLHESEAETELQRQSVLGAISRSAELRNKLVQAEEMGSSLDRQIARLHSERESAETEHRQIAGNLATIEAGHSLEEGTLSALAQSIAAAQAAVSQAREELAARRDDSERLSRELSHASARKQALEESLARHAYTSDSVRRLLSTSSPENGFHPLGVLADFLDVAPGYEDVVEEFLKTELDCVVVEKHEEARHGITLLQNDGGGRSAFFIRYVPRNGHGHENGHAAVAEAKGHAGVVASLQELVKLQPRLGLNGDLAFPVLAHSFVVDDAATAENMAAAYPSCHFLTPQGDHYHHRLVSGGKRSSSGPLALRRDFREMERRAAELQGAWTHAQQQATEAQTTLEFLEGEARRLAEEQIRAEKQSVLSGEKLRQAREALQHASDRVQVLGAELAVLDKERRAIEPELGGLQEQLQQARSVQEQSEKAMATAAEAAQGLRSELDVLNKKLTAAEVSAGALEERWRAAEAEISRATAEAAQTRQRLARLENQAEAWSVEAKRLREESQDVERLRAEQENQLQVCRGRLQAGEEECRAARLRRDELGPQVELARGHAEMLREKRSETEVALARTESDLRHLVQQIREELSAEPDALHAELSPEALLSGEPLQAAESGLRELRARLEKLGPVNMMALEELQEAEQRLNFLETQRQDLLASINDTTQTIREIDEASRHKFMEAFNAVNAYFAEAFKTLFGGGAGEMRFSDEADAESGIELVVQPPGKRLQNVLLLSGGEKALTALALLIAIFRFRPSPFCILDEVDAPLDDTNVIRFAQMIRVMSSHTQFILITHNKRTMEACGMMYGVTMEEPGVSKLVSVRLQEQRRETRDERQETRDQKQKAAAAFVAPSPAVEHG